MGNDSPEAYAETAPKEPTQSKRWIIAVERATLDVIDYNNDTD